MFPGEEWETATPASQGMDAEGLAQAKAWLESHHSKSGVVIRHGRIVAEWYFGDADRYSKFAAYSTTKSLSSMATGLAIADGKLALDHTRRPLLSGRRPGRQTGGDRQAAPEHDVGRPQRSRASAGVRTSSAMPCERPRWTTRPARSGTTTTRDWRCSAPSSRKRPAVRSTTYLSERVFRPIGVRADDWKWEHYEGYALPYSGWHTTARSLGRVGLLVLQQGKWNDKQIVPAAWLAESIAPSQELNKSYGYLWWNNTTNKWPGVPQDAYAALGKWDNNIFVAPGLDLVVIRQSDLAPGKDHKIAEYYELVCKSVK